MILDLFSGAGGAILKIAGREDLAPSDQRAAS